MTPRQPLGLQPHPAREQRPPKHQLPHLIKKSKKTKGKKISKCPRGSGRPGSQSTTSTTLFRVHLIEIYRPRPWERPPAPPDSRTAPQNLATSVKVPSIRCPPILDQAGSLPHFSASFTCTSITHYAPAIAWPTASPSSRTATPKTPVSAPEKKGKKTRVKQG